MTVHKNIFSILMMYLLMNTFSSNAQTPAYRHFTDEDGLPSMTVYEIKQDLNGYLWMNTTKGICRFDGLEFKKYEVPDLKGQDIPYFFMDDEGMPWFYNMAGELFYIKNDSIKRLNIKSPAIDMTISSFYTNQKNIYITWLSNNQSISIQYNKNNPNQFKQLKESYGFIRLGNDSAIAAKKAFRDYCFELYNLQDNHLLFDLSYYHGKYFNYDNEIYFANKISEDTLALFTPYFCGILNNHFELIKPISLQNITRQRILYLSPLNRDHIFLKTPDNSIILNIRNDKSEIETGIGSAVNTIIEDRYGRRWISTTNKGLYLSFQNKVSIYTNANSKIYSNEISCLNTDDPFLIAGHNNGSLSILNLRDQSWEIIHNPGLGRIKSILKINTTQYLVGSDNGIFECHLIGRNKFKIDLLKEISSKGIIQLNEDQFLLLANNGSYRASYSELKNKNFTLSDKNRTINIRSTSACRFKDSIFVGTVKGMYASADVNYQKWQLISKDELYINKLFNLNDSILWICTDGNGVYLYCNGKIIDSLNISNGMPSNSVSSVTAIDNHRLVFGTDNGAYVYDIITHTGFGFNQLDGLPGKEILDIGHSDDMLWIGTAKGLVTVSIEKLKANPEKPYLSIAKSMAFSNGGEIDFTTDLPYHSNHLRFVLQTRSLLSKDQLKIYYKLNDTDTTWIKANSKILEFVGLTPGSYNLVIKAINEDGVASEQPVNLSFVINPPWWKTIWFNAIMLTCLIGGSVGMTYWRQMKLRTEEDKKRKIKDQMNQLRQEALQNQMNPHFIFNALNAIQNFLLVNDEMKAVSYMSKFGRLIRMIFEQSKLKFISLEDEINLLNHYIHLEELRFGHKITVTFNVEPELMENASEITIPPLLIQPIVENSFRHGLFHLEKNGFLSINLFKKLDHIICVVQDNGVGREKSRKINEWKNKTHKSSGINSTLERLEILDQGRNKLGLEIIDLYDEAGNPCGTKAILTL